MTSALDMSLDDLIKNNKQVGRGGGGGGGGGGAGGRGGRGGGVRRSTANNGAGYGGGGNMGPSRRQFARSAARPTPYATAKAVHRAPTDGAWQHDLYDEAAAVVPSSRSLGIETGTKLYISNLDYGVSNDDIKVSLITLQAFSLIELEFRLQEAH
jgi:THO complex subunit 4